MNLVVLCMLTALSIELCVLLLNSRRINSNWRTFKVVLYGVLAALIGSFVGLYILNERKAYNEFANKAIQVGFEIIGERLDSPLKSCEYTLKKLRNGVVISACREAGEKESIELLIERCPFCVYEKRK